MNGSQKFGIICLILITLVYVYFSFCKPDGHRFPASTKSQEEQIHPFVKPSDDGEEEEQENTKKELKTVKIYVTDSKGNLRSVNRKCDTSVEKSCFAFAIKELISAPSNWEKSNKGLSSEIPSNTKILSIREGDTILIDLSSAFESGGGAESTYIRVRQLIKTAKANTKLPVYLYINGKQANVIGGEGIMVKQPLSERSLDD